MTREEAIKRLKGKIVTMKDGAICCDYGNDKEVFDMAIKALEQEPCEDWCDVPSGEMTLEQARQAVKDLRKKLAEHLEKEPCKDAISREAVLEAVSKIGLCKCNTNEIEAVDECLRVVKALPPVTPQPKTGRWISFGTKGEIDGQIVRTFICSECDAISIFRVTNGNIVNGDLCPNCGAKMVEPQESEKYCDRNICVSNGYNGIGCDECEVTKSREPQESEGEK